MEMNKVAKWWQEMQQMWNPDWRRFEKQWKEDRKLYRANIGDLSFDDERIEWIGGRNDEPAWFAVLAEWSASMLDVGEYRQAMKKGGVRIWLCTMFHVVTAFHNRIADLEARIAVLEANDDC